MPPSRSLNSVLCDPPRPSASESSALSAASSSNSNASAAGADIAPVTSKRSAASTRSGEIEAMQVKVAVRLKPLSSNKTRAWRVLPDSRTIVQECPLELPVGVVPANASKPAAAANSGQSTFTFDHVYREDSTTTQVYNDMAEPIVSATLQGFNGTVFVYGQTSAGKTHTMQGSRKVTPLPAKLPRKQQRKQREANNKNSQPVDGITHMAARDIFDRIANDAKHTYDVRVSFLEIYNEEVRDLLVDGGGGSNGGTGGNVRGSNRTPDRTLAVREDPKRDFFVDNLSSHRVDNLDTLLRYLNIGERHKSVAKTAMNDRSSRSHTIFRITVERKKKKIGVSGGAAKPSGAGVSGKENGGTAAAAFARNGDAGTLKLVATLNLVDLAGSESVGHTGSTGTRAWEGGKINQSLLTLSQVIMGLGKAEKRGKKGGKTHVNYRDSKLTMILQSSLSGNARMAVICCATPSDEYTEETKSTLGFASRAKLVKTRAAVNEVHSDPSVIKQLQREIKQLQREIAQQSNEGKQTKRQLEDALQEALRTIEELKMDRVKIQEENDKLQDQIKSINSLVAGTDKKKRSHDATRTAPSILEELMGAVKSTSKLDGECHRMTTCSENLESKEQAVHFHSPEIASEEDDEYDDYEYEYDDDEESSSHCDDDDYSDVITCTSTDEDAEADSLTSESGDVSSRNNKGNSIPTPSSKRKKLVAPLNLVDLTGSESDDVSFDEKSKADSLTSESGYFSTSSRNDTARRKRKGKRIPPPRSKRKKKVVDWDHRFNELKQYKAANGHCNVPRRWKVDPPLGRWVSRQRTQCRLRNKGKQTQMTDERIAKLESIGFLWSLKDRIAWDKRFNELKQYKKIHRHCNVPREWEDNPTLGDWVHEQRNQYRLLKDDKQSSITDERREKLESIGFE